MIIIITPKKVIIIMAARNTDIVPERTLVSIKGKFLPNSAVTNINTNYDEKHKNQKSQESGYCDFLNFFIVFCLFPVAEGKNTPLKRQRHPTDTDGFASGTLYGLRREYWLNRSAILPVSW